MHTQTTHTKRTTHALSQVQNRIPKLQPHQPPQKHRFPSPSPPSQLRPVAVGVVHKLQHHPLGVARRTAPKAHTRGAVRRARAHPEQVVAQRRAVQPVVPRPRRRGHRRAPPVARVACSGRSWSRCSRSSAAPTSRSARPHSPVPAPPSLRSTSAPCAHGAPSRAPTQRSTPDAGANARSQRAL